MKIDLGVSMLFKPSEAEMTQTKSTRCFVCIVVLMLSLIGLPCLYAQTGSGGTIQGTITDPGNAVIPGAKVTVTNIETGVVTNARSTSAGYYAVPALIPGVYSVQIEKSGFKSYTQENISVSALQVVGINVKLSVGETSESVTVTAAPPALETENASMTVNMENETYTALPLNMGGSQRDPTSFASLTPGYSGGGRSGTYNGAGGDDNGSSDSGAVTYLDGLPISQGDNRQISLAVSVDAVDQFQVTSSGANASQTGMGSQNYNVKHGTNKIHGSAYDYVRNTAFDSWNFFAKAVTVPTASGTNVQQSKPAEHQNEMGFTIGGPIKKDKMFNFLSGELYRYTAYVNPSLMTVPTKAMRNGDFSALLDSTTKSKNYVIYDPSTLSLSTKGNYSASAFANNVIPSSRISQISKNMLSFLPMPSSGMEDETTDNYLSSHQTGNDNYEVTDRFDWVITPQQRISLLGNTGKRGFIGYDYNETSTLPLPYVNGVLVTQFMDSLIFEHTFIVTSNFVNQFKMGYVRMNSPVKNPSEQNSSTYAATAMGIGNLPDGGASNDFPAVTFSGGKYGYSAWYSPTGYKSTNNQIVLHDDISWSHGKHLISAGFDFATIQKNASSWLGTSAPLSLTYNSSVTKGFTGTSSNLTSTSGDSLATYLIGGVSSSLTLAPYSTLGTRVKPFSFYGQDDWKVKPNLTLNVGLRWDIFPVVVESQDRGSFMNPTLVNSITGTYGAMSYLGYGTGKANRRSAGNTYLGNFAPRVGLAYTPIPNWVIRAGFGINYSRNGSANSTTGQTNINKKNTYPSTLNGEKPYFYLDNSNSNFPAWSSTPSMTSTDGTGYYYDSSTGAYNNSPLSMTMAYPGTSVRPPTVYNWNFGVQHSLMRSLVLSVNYVGSASHFLSSDKNYMGTDSKYNVIGQYLSLSPLGVDGTTGKTYLALAQARFPGIALPYSGYGGANATISHMLNKYPQYSSVSQTWGTYANADYHALQATLTQKTWHGFSYTANFTYSRTMDNTSDYRANGDVIPGTVYITGKDVRLDKLEHTLSTYDQPFNLKFFGQYRLPFGKNMIGGNNRYARQVGSGWQLSWIYSIASGRPLSFSPDSLYYNPNFSGKIRINGKYGKGYLAKMSNSPRYINSDAFLQVPKYMIGSLKENAPYNLRYPHSSDIDMAIMRSFDIYKDVKFIFRAEVFNLTNHTEFKGIGTGLPSTYTATDTDFGDGGGAFTLGSSDTFGRVSSQSNSARDWQFSGKITF
jgi:hypothetical protein